MTNQIKVIMALVITERKNNNLQQTFIWLLPKQKCVLSVKAKSISRFKWSILQYSKHTGQIEIART